MKNEEERNKWSGAGGQRSEEWVRVSEEVDPWDEEALVCVGLKILERLGIDGELQGLGAVGE